MNGIDWEQLTSKPINEITLDDKITVLTSYVVQTEKRTRCLSWHSKVIWAVTIGTPTLIIFLGWLTLQVVG